MKKFIVQVTECVDYHYDVVIEAADAYQAAVKAETLVEEGKYIPLGDEVTGVFATNIKESENGEAENQDQGQDQED